MKCVLITGANSYIGTSFEKWVREHDQSMKIETLDMKGQSWKTKSFQGYDSVFHVAGIAHADVGKVTEEQKKLYYQVNSELTIECAKKAKAEGVRQFVFMSSIIVYGESAGIGKKRVITRQTPFSPANFYGDSKVKAEEGLQKLSDEKFKIVILRPPMIYGKGSKGNYPVLAKMARKLPMFPEIKNERSMLHIENLCEFVRLMIQNEESGIFFPQNQDYVQTSHMVQLIGAEYGKNIHLTKIFNPALRILGKTSGKVGNMINKAFGNLVYEKEMSEYRENYRINGLEESVKKTESIEA